MNAFEKFLAARPGYFVRDVDMPELIKLHRLCLLVARCGGCRFMCPAQDLAFLIKAIEKAGDYVRDVSVHSTEIANAQHWRPEIGCYVAPKPKEETGVNLQPLTKALTEIKHQFRFDENDCSGVFDGVNTVTSDADPGL